MEKENKIREEIINLLKLKNKINLLDLPKILNYDVDGNYEMINPKNNNCIFISGVSKKFINILEDLFYKERIINFDRSSIYDYIFEGTPLYNLPIQNKQTKTKTWIPIKITLNK